MPDRRLGCSRVRPWESFTVHGEVNPILGHDDARIYSSVLLQEMKQISAIQKL